MTSDRAEFGRSAAAQRPDLTKESRRHWRPSAHAAVMALALLAMCLTAAPVSAVGAGGRRPTSVGISDVGIAETVPSTVRSLGVVRVAPTSVSLSWLVPSDDGGAPITDYVVELSTDLATWNVVDDGIEPTTQATITGLAPETYYAFRVAAQNTVGIGATSDPVDATTRALTYVPLESPVRLIDTRAGLLGALEGESGTVGWDVAVKLQAGVPARWVMASAAGLPADVAALALNVTAIAPPDRGNLRVYPCNEVIDTRPTVSTLNYRAGVTSANAAIVAPAANGGVCAMSTQTLDVTLDASGYFSSENAFVPLGTPERLVDTRAGEVGTLESPASLIGTDIGVRLQSGVPVRWSVAGNSSSIPSDAVSIALNLIAISPSANGNLRMYPCESTSSAPPTTSNLNFTAGVTIANAAIVAVAQDGGLCVVSSQPTHVAVDAAGYFTTSSALNMLPSPVRLVDSRPGLTGALESLFAPLGGDVRVKLMAGVPVRWRLTGVASIPIDATGLALNLTAVAPPAKGNLRVYPCSTSSVSPPSTSNLNYMGGMTIANAAVVAPYSGGAVCVLSTQTIDVVIDVAGYFVG